MSREVMNDARAGLAAVLGDQVRCAHEMLQALDRETEALLAGDAEKLDAAGAEKARLVEALEALESERRALTAAIASGIADATRDMSEARPPQWQELLELIARCKEQNERNGVLVRARSEQVRSALRALRGAEPDLYGRSGTTPTSPEARRLGTA